MTHRLWGTVLVATLIVGLPTVAVGAEPDYSGEQDAVDAITQIAPEAVEGSPLSSDGIAPESPGHAPVAEVPVDPTNPVTVSSTAGEQLQISIPSSETTDAGVAIDGVLVFDHDNGSYTVPLVKDAGSAQFTTVIEHSTAPTTYEYELGNSGLPSVGFVGGIPTGQVIIRTAGWSELTTKMPGVTSKATIYQQFECHVFYGYSIWGSGFWWDFERASRNWASWNSVPLSNHYCNW